MEHRTQHRRAKWDLEGGEKASGCAGGQAGYILWCAEGQAGYILWCAGGRVGYILWCRESSWKRCLSGALIPPGPILHTVGV